MNDLEIKNIKVWDIPTRLFHWALVVAVGFMWYSSGDFELMEYHLIVGRLILCALIFRILWGFIGSTTARFTDFIRSPVTGLRYLFGKESSKTAGHNPAGGWMVLALLIILLTQALSGLFASDDVSYPVYAGPFYFSVNADIAEWLNRLHHRNINYLWILVGVHVYASLIYQLQGKNLTGSMLSGKKQAQEGVKPQEMRSPWLALVLFMVICAVGFYLTRY